MSDQWEEDSDDHEDDLRGDRREEILQDEEQGKADVTRGPHNNLDPLAYVLEQRTLPS
jgi:hypothetical protein